MRLVIGSKEDPASMSMSNFILDNMAMKEVEGVPGLLEYGDFYFRIINEKHLFCDNLKSYVEENNLDVNGVVFLSKHSSAADVKSITVHPTGNFSEAKLGGVERTLSESDPVRMSAALRTLKSAYEGDGFEVTFEATHHGPFLTIPHYYIEIGTTENEWTDKGALEAVMEAVFRSSERNFKNFVGVGGGHYMPKITKYFFENEVNIGHMIPKYQMDTVSKELVEQTVQRTANCSGFIIDGKGTKSRVRDIIMEVSDEYNLETIKI